MCRNSFDPQCGAFHWDPTPINQPIHIDPVAVDPADPIVGQPVTVTIHWSDPDADIPMVTTFCDGTGCVASDPAVHPCPRLPTGPWTPPLPNPGAGTLVEHLHFPTAGTFNWEIELTTFSSTSRANCTSDPYVSTTTVADSITIADLLPYTAP